MLINMIKATYTKHRDIFKSMVVNRSNNVTGINKMHPITADRQVSIMLINMFSTSFYVINPPKTVIYVGVKALMSYCSIFSSIAVSKT